MSRKYLCLVVVILLICRTVPATNVKDFGAKGDGLQDDTGAIKSALAACRDGRLVFPAGNYRLTQSIRVDLQENGPLTISGTGGSTTVIMDAPGPAFLVAGTHQGSALPATVNEKIWAKEKMFTVENLEITGKNPLADGIELQQLMQPIVRGCLIRKVRHGIRLTRRNRNVLLEGNHIYHCSGVGIYLDSVNIHQINISHSHISYCSEAGIKVRHGEIRNFQITGNDIEYNCDPASGLESADICLDLTQGGNVREGTITGNTIQAIESKRGANIRFSGDPARPEKLGLWSITGNHISNQETCILLRHTQGISITGNTFVRAYKRHLDIENSSNIIFTGNVIDHNADYFTPGVKAVGGIFITNSRQVMLHDNFVTAVGPGIDAAIEIVKGKGVSVKNCTIIKSGSPGIRLTDSPGSIITGNVISRPDKKRKIVSMNGNSHGSYVRGNLARD